MQQIAYGGVGDMMRQARQIQPELLPVAIRSEDILEDLVAVVRPYHSFSSVLLDESVRQLNHQDEQRRNGEQVYSPGINVPIPGLSIVWQKERFTYENTQDPFYPNRESLIFLSDGTLHRFTGSRYVKDFYGTSRNWDFQAPKAYPCCVNLFPDWARRGQVTLITNDEEKEFKSALTRRKLNIPFYSPKALA